MSSAGSSSRSALDEASVRLLKEDSDLVLFRVGKDDVVEPVAVEVAHRDGEDGGLSSFA